ncbi:MAG: hypothetical protein AUG49_14835 [Catenulispora sp. 13_1_20CM_3_70_7]|nr:MAG: hypothetical protein AUG49_14835 [Catenulispora sp. 13_1_20CM_3_70_7]
MLDDAVVASSWRYQLDYLGVFACDGFCTNLYWLALDECSIALAWEHTTVDEGFGAVRKVDRAEALPVVEPSHRGGPWIADCVQDELPLRQHATSLSDRLAKDYTV